MACVVGLASRVGSELAVRIDLAARFELVAGVSGATRLERALNLGVLWRIVAMLAAGTALFAMAQGSMRAKRRWLVVLAFVFVAHGAVQWVQLATPRTGEFAGTAVAITDAATQRGRVSLIVRVDGQRFRLSVYGRDRSVLRDVRMGDHVVLTAQRTAYDHRRLRFVAGRHVQGELREVQVHAVVAAPRIWHRAANRIHHHIDHGSRTMQPHDAALVRGFLLGDESRHPDAMTAAFRGAGLGHLLAVSGQNVALILATLTPLLRRLSRWPRLACALGIVAMFAVTTRLEASVVRAAVMAGIVQVGFAIGRDVAPLRALVFTVVGLVALDPLVTWSIGFVLSVAATTGLVVITPMLGTSMLAATTAAQLAVSPFVLWWFRTLPGIALATNVLAVPVASAVMMCGPILLSLAAVSPDSLAALWCAPVVAAVRWVWWVAEWGTRLSPPGVFNALLWALVGVVVAVRSIRTINHRRARLEECPVISSPVTTSGWSAPN